MFLRHLNCQVDGVRLFQRTATLCLLSDIARFSEVRLAATSHATTEANDARFLKDKHLITI